MITTLLADLQTKHGFTIHTTKPLSGGDISDVYRLNTDKGSFVIKVHTPEQYRMFRAEAEGLKALYNADTCRTPQVIDMGRSDSHAYLLMEYIASGNAHPNTFKDFAVRLSSLHQTTSDTFGFETNNFIGTLPQSNQKHDSWAAFYTHERLLPQLRLAQKLKRLDLIPSTKTMESVCQSEFNPHPPALLHGDLWSGNYMIDESGQVVLIDPSVYYGHPMMDLGMMRLFGGFPEDVFRNYFEHSTLNTNIDRQIELAQLYYLLVHLNLFGHSYQSSVVRILKKFF